MAVSNPLRVSTFSRTSRLAATFLAVLPRCCLVVAAEATTRLQIGRPKFPIVRVQAGTSGCPQTKAKGKEDIVTNQHPIHVFINKTKYELDDSVQNGASLKRLANIKLEDVLFL